MNKNFLALAVAAALLLSFTSCDDNACNTDYAKSFPAETLYQITPIEGQPFMGETYINDFDYEAGNDFLVKRFNYAPSGACSSFRAGGYAARNLDWYIRDYAMLIVHIPGNAEKGRYASVGIVSSNPFINREMIAGGAVKDTVLYNGAAITGWRDMFPIFTTDGINEKGVCVNTNIVVHEDGVRQGYIPCTGVEGKPYTNFISLPRYILDNCASADDAVKKCAQLNLCQSCSGPLATEDSHIMVSDASKTVVIEWYNNQMVYTEYKSADGGLYKSEEGMPAIMTNFYNYLGKKHLSSAGDGSIDFAGLLAEHPYAMGVERYETLRDGLENVCSIGTAMEQIKKVYYTNYYDISKGWCTENGFACKLIDGIWYYPTNNSAGNKNYKPAASIDDAVRKTFAAESFQEDVIERFGNFDQRMQDLSNGIECENEWYTELTDIFDIGAQELYVLPQQGWFKNTFTKFTIRGEYK